MQVRWHGHSFFSLIARDGTSVLIDPFIDGGPTRLRVTDFHPDLVLVTHGHADHVGSALELRTPILTNWEISLALRPQAKAEVIGMGVGGFAKLRGLRIWCAPAVHSSGLDGLVKGDGIIPYGGSACGFVVDDGETRFYHAGDTAIFSDMRHVVRDLLQPHVAAVPIGDFFTMGPEHAARAVEWLGVNVAVPMHYDSFDIIRQDPADFERRVGTAARVVIPPIDGGFEVRGSQFVSLLA